MFTGIMNDEEKEKFLELIFKTATCDGEYADEEKELISSYMMELNLSEIKDTATIQELIDYFANKPLILQKIVCFEMYGMIMADEMIEKDEERIMNCMKKKFKLETDDFDSIMLVANKLKKIYDEIYTVIYG